jgi:hypothetical protein
MSLEANLYFNPAALRDDVLVVLAKGPLPFAAVCKRFGVDPKHGSEFRKIDAALQKLRRAGKISYERRTGWSVKTA